MRALGGGRKPLTNDDSILQNFQQAVVTICSEKFGCPSRVPLSKFEKHLFLMTAFQVYHGCSEHWEDSSKFGGLERALSQCMGSMGGGTGGGTP